MLLGNSLCLHNTQKIGAWPTQPEKQACGTWVVPYFPVSMNITPTENQKDGTREEPLGTCVQPYLPKDVVVIRSFQEPFAVLVGG